MSADVPAVVRRAPAVAGAFYPAGTEQLRELVRHQLGQAARESGPPGRGRASVGWPIGILVPHAGLAYSGVVAAAAWRLLAEPHSRDGSSDASRDVSPTVVILGTNHRAIWLDGIGAWERGSWRLPGGDVEVDDRLATEIVALGRPFLVDRDAHLEEHSIEVQLPFLAAIIPDARCVPLAVSTGIGSPAIDAGTRLGELLGTRRAAGDPIVLVISSDMAHYPSGIDAEAVTSILRPAITGLDPAGLAARETFVRERSAMGRGPRGLACGMCGIEPAVVGLAALRAMGATRGTVLATATSADVGGPPDRTVGYLAARFD